MDAFKVEGALGAELAARVDRPAGPIRAVALFAHCFTCGKDIRAAREIARRLADQGVATVRFDFTGLGGSDGEFASTHFSSNVGDLVKMADALRETIGAPRLLIGHSLGGAAVLVAAAQIPEVRAVATIAAPADAEHVTRTFAAQLDRIEEEGAAPVELSGRRFTIRREFVDDLRRHRVTDAARTLDAALMVMHAPLDDHVGIDNATRIFVAAKHPKSFVSLGDADHLLSDPADARYAADVIAAWASRFALDALPARGTPAAVEGGVRASVLDGAFRTALDAAGFPLTADEPAEVGGEGSGPTPYDYLGVALASCTLMTMRLYGARKGWVVDATVDVTHGKVHRDDCEACVGKEAGKDGRIDRFERVIRFGPGTETANRDRLVEIADRCPVHLTLERGAAIVTRSE
ncbi:alpha/beta fold hydrolase [Acuticoccus sp. I52.16.1]|uniref:bifunctional alpha/beta hydrolase/OsmC family protein n=1 Tax=Acuticoccus sp. I52.16.1 TaxID=2928472 RepID=UPI001FD0B2D4|nr:alpha/beta fold hydrolase [Acuticoccus sp. I52.16.1]UOM34251.1 alpha/beta fold hydrolase [Acuticoccus sp. I52.16.1]